MLRQLVEYAEQTDEVVPGHKAHPRSTNNLWRVRLRPDGTDVVSSTKRHYLADLTSVQSANPAVGCDFVKDVAGVRGKEQYLPESGNWKDTKMGRAYREILSEAIESADGRLKKVLSVIEQRLPAISKKLEEKAHYKDAVVFVDDIHGDAEPLAQVEGEAPTGLQNRLQEINLGRYAKSCTEKSKLDPKTAQCSCCGEQRKLAYKFPGRGAVSSTFPSKNQDTFLKGQSDTAFSLHVCAECATKAIAAWGVLSDSDNDLWLPSGLKWVFFSPTEETSLYARCLNGDMDEQTASRVRDQLHKGKGRDKGRSGQVNMVVKGSSVTAGGQRDDFWHAESMAANRLWGRLDQWLSYQDTEFSNPIGILSHLENLAHTPKDGDGNKTRLYGEAEDTTGDLAQRLPRLATKGRRLPISTVRPLLNRIRSKDPQVRSYDLNRVLPTLLWSNPMNENDVGYKLGCLLSIGDEVYDRIDGEDYQMSRRYFSKLYSQPQVAYGRLMKDVRTRLQQLDKKTTPSADLEKRLRKTVLDLEDSVPRSLSPQGQVQFNFGYEKARKKRFESDSESGS